MKYSSPADSTSFATGFAPLLKPVLPFRNYRLRLVKFAVPVIACLLQAAVAGAQTTYNWQTTTGTWSGSTNWSPTVAGTAGPGAVDTANIDNLATSSTIIYDAPASGTIGTLTLQQSVNNVSTALSLTKNLTIATAGSIYTTTGTEQINLNNSNLTIASGADLILGSTSTNVNLTTASQSYITTAGSGTVIVDGTLESAYAFSADNTFQPVVNAPATLAAGGTIDVETDGTSGSGDARIVFNGNFDSSAGGTLEATSTSGTSFAMRGMIFFEGGTTVIGNTTITGFKQGGNIAAAGGIVFGGTLGTQVIELGQSGTTFDFGLRTGSAGTSAANAVFIKNISSTSVTGTITNAIGDITMNTSNNYSTIEVQLGSNLQATFGDVAFNYNWATTSGDAAIDLNGFEYNMTTYSAATSFGISNGTVGQNTFNFVNSGSSSIANGQGIFKAAAFNLSTFDVGVGNGVILQATYATGTSNLGVATSGTTTVSANSTFYYTGTGSGGLASNRNIGGITVGNGTAVSTLVLYSTITAAGSTTLNTKGTLDLNSMGLTLMGAANLVGSGTVANTGSGGTGISFASGATGGLTPGGGTTVAKLTLSNGLAVGLASTSLSIFDLASTGSYDQISGGSLTLAGTLEINLLTGFTESSATNFTLLTSSLSGGFSNPGNVTLEGSGAAGYSATFNNATGVLSVIAVPEPSTTALMISAVLCGSLVFYRRSKSGTGT